MIVKDSMVLIHLAKTTLLEKSCDMFRDVIIPERVHEETVSEGKRKGYDDSIIIESLVGKGKINIKAVKDKDVLAQLADLNVHGGEAEAVALYWQEKAGMIASDDSNVLRKRHILGINLIGTPSILLTLYKNKKIDKDKLKASIKRLREIGWFNNTILDKILMEAERGDNYGGSYRNKNG